MQIPEKDQQINLKMLRVATENAFGGYAMVYLNEETHFDVNFAKIPPIENILDDVRVSEYDELQDLIIDDETLETEFPYDEDNLKKLIFALLCVPIVRIMFWSKLTDEDRKDVQYYRENRKNLNDDKLDLDSFGAGMAINDRLSPDGLAYYTGVEREDF